MDFPLHHNRRSKIWNQYTEVKQLIGHDSRTAIIILIVITIQFIIAHNIHNYQWYSLLLLSYWVGAVLNHWCAMAIHESSHNLVFHNVYMNRLFAIVCNFPMVFPGAMSFFRYHYLHHLYLGQEGSDNDLPSEWKITNINTTFRKFIWVTFFFFFGIFARGFVRRLNKWEVFNIVVQMSINILIIKFLGYNALFYLSMSTFFSMSLHPIAGHYLHEHYNYTDDSQETYSYYGILNYVSLNVGYHNEHHDFPNIPNSKLPYLHEIAKKHYGKLTYHNSWIWTMYKFITDPNMSHCSRIIRKN